MPDSIDDLIPNAKQIQRKRPSRRPKRQKNMPALPLPSNWKKRALIERSAVRQANRGGKGQARLDSDSASVRNGLTEVQVYRFPNTLCTDKGRAINQQEPGWENTLTGIPKEIFQLWTDYLKPRGYRISYQIIDFPEGLPGDIAITIAWGD